MKFSYVIATLVIFLLSQTAAQAGGRHHSGHHRGHGGSHFGFGFSRGGYGHGFGHHRRGYSRFNFNFGSPLWWGPRHYYQPNYYAPAPIIVQQQPAVYVQRPPVVTAPPVTPAAPQVTRYYCPNPAGYYPHVQSCSQAWIDVDPSTVAPATAR